MRGIKLPLIIFLAFLILPTVAHAHFGMLIPSRDTVFNQKQGEIDILIAFAHPFEQKGMEMQPPVEFFMDNKANRTNLLPLLKPVQFLEKNAFNARFKIGNPGVYRIGLVPEPYYEPAEDSFIIHYVKTVIGAFGNEDGWTKPLGFPVEIVPLVRPFANYAGNSFTGLALKNGKPLANAPVEVEFFNKDNLYKAPNEYFVTQSLLTDANGVFTFAIPWAGWWGFAVLTDGELKVDDAGKKKDVELGGVLWLEFAAPIKE